MAAEALRVAAAQQNQRVREAFYALLDASPSERPALLRALARDHAATHREVAALLRGIDAADGFLERTASREPLLSPGSLVGPWRVKRTLGFGGMGVVYLAEHRKTRKAAAVKTVRGLRPGHLQSLRREIDVLSQLRHPGIVRILDHGSASLGPWYAMELVRGVPILQHLGQDASIRDSVHWSTRLGARAAAPSRRMPRRPLRSVRAVLTLVRRICEPLGYLHGEGLVHGDLKPANVLVRPSGHPVLLDCGVTTRFWQDVARDDLDLLPAGGTLSFMAPEIVDGTGSDARADLYALGCILYLALTASLPHAEPSSWTAAKVRQPPAPPSSRRRGVPAAVDDLVLRLLSRDPRDRPGHALHVARTLEAAGAARDVRRSRRAPRPYLYRPDIVGRDDELARAEQLLEAAEPGSGILMVKGESGVGKTRFAMALAQRAHWRGFVVAGGAGAPPGEAREALHPLRTPLLSLAERLRDGGREEARRVFGSNAAVLAPLLPGLADVLEGQLGRIAPAPPLPPDAARLRLLRALRGTFEAAALDRPLLLVLDDLQWADEVTLDLVQLMGSPPSGAGARTRLLCLFRAEEAPERLRALAESAPLVTLERLPQGAVASMIEQMVSSPVPAPFLEALWEHTEGNPFFVAEYLRAAVAEGQLSRDAYGRWQVRREAPSPSRLRPAAVRDLVTRRLARHGREARRLAMAAAVLGREVDADLLETMGGLGPGATARALHELRRAQTLEARPDGTLRFAHDKIREAAYASIPPLARRQLHRRAAEAMGKHDDPASRGARAMHCERGGNRAEARRLYLLAARTAADRAALQDAGQYYESYLRLVRHPSADSIAARAELASRVYRVRGRMAAAESELRRAVREASSARERGAKAEATRQLGTVLMDTGRGDEAWAAFEAAASLWRKIGDRWNEALVLGNQANMCHARGRIDEALALCDRALAIHREAGNRPGEGAVLGNLASLRSLQGRMEEALGLYEESIAIARETGDRYSEGLRQSNLALVHHRLGRMAEARAISEQALAIHREIGDRRNEGRLLGNLASLHMEQGRMEEARVLYEQALASDREIGSRRGEAIVLSNLASLYSEQGRLADSQELRGQALELLRRDGNRQAEGVTLSNGAGVLWRQGRKEEALAAYHQALAIHRDIGDRRSEGTTLGEMAGAYVEEGRMGEARALYDQALAIHREVGNRHSEAKDLAGRALHDVLTTGDLESAEAQASLGEKLITEVGDKVRLGELLCVRGHLALAAGRSAAEALARARKLALEIGVLPESALVRAIAKLARAEGASESGQPLVCGHRADDLSPPVLRWLREHRPETVQATEATPPHDGGPPSRQARGR